MTRIVALLCFYDEQPSWLYDTAVSLALVGADQLVASDGAYALYPNGKPSSGADSHDALREASTLTGIPLHLHVPETVWAGNELEKRTHMFRLGDEHAADWWLVIDADERIVRAPDDLKTRLAETDRDYADVMSLEQPAPVWGAGMDDDSFPQIYAERHVKPRRCLIRAVPGTRVVGGHYHYVTPDGRDLWGDEYGRPLQIRDMMIDHRNGHREEARYWAAQRLYDLRDQTGAEPSIPPAPSPRVPADVAERMGWTG